MCANSSPKHRSDIPESAKNLAIIELLALAGALKPKLIIVKP
jgi:hypothetical protein